jgi:hypothetical protein
MFYTLSVFNQAYPARLRSQFTGFPNISPTNALFCHETGAPAFEEAPCRGRARPDRFPGTRVSSDRQPYWDYEGDRRSLATLDTSRMGSAPPASCPPRSGSDIVQGRLLASRCDQPRLMRIFGLGWWSLLPAGPDIHLLPQAPKSYRRRLSLCSLPVPKQSEGGIGSCLRLVSEEPPR